MKHLFQIPIILLMLWASGYSYASTACVALGGGEIEAYVTKACGDGSATGAIDLQINDGTAGYEIYYYNSVGIQINENGSEDVNSLLPGTYHIIVVDSKCAKAEMDVIVGTFAPIIITADIRPLCQDGTGSISPIVQGGSGEYTFLWSNGATTQNISNLTAGSYYVKVMDSNGCTKNQNFALSNVTSPLVFPSNFEIKIPTTCSTTDGYISTWRYEYNITGGVPPFTYMWSNGATTDVIGPVQSGIYTVTVTDAAGCTGSKTQILNADDQIIHDIEMIHPTCPGKAEGSITLLPNQPVIYYCNELGIVIDSEEDGFLEIIDLYAGTYCFKIFSKYGNCNLEKCYEIKEKVSDGPLTVSGTVKKSCPGEGTGSITLNVTGGYSKYSYSSTWSPGGRAYSLSPGTYIVTVTDDCGDIATATFEMSDYDVQPIKIAGDFPDALPPEKGQLIQHTITGGSGNFKYKWEYSKTPNPNDPEYLVWYPSYVYTKDYKIPIGKKYRFTVTDRLTGCDKSVIYDCIAVAAEVTNTCPGWEEGAITINPYYPKIGLKYNWSNGKTTQNIAKLGKGTYTVTISNESCSIIESFIITDAVKEKDPKPTFNDKDGCGLTRQCNTQTMFEKYDQVKHKDWIVDQSMKIETKMPVNCVDQEHFCPLIKREQNKNPKIKKDWYPYNVRVDFDECRAYAYCEDVKTKLNHISYGLFISFGLKLEGGKCVETVQCKIPNPNADHPEALNNKWFIEGPKKKIDKPYSECCPITGIEIISIDSTVVNFKLTGSGNKALSGTIKIGNVEYRKNGFCVGCKYTAGIRDLPIGNYTIEIIFDDGCSSVSTTFSKLPPPVIKCPDEFYFQPNPVNEKDNHIVTIKSLRVISGCTLTYVNRGNGKTYYNGNNITLEIKPNEISVTIPEAGVYDVTLTIPGCSTLKKTLIVLLLPGIKEDCDKDFFNITSNVGSNSFNTYWVEDNIVKGASFGKSNNKIDVYEHFGVTYADYPIKMIRNDNIGNHIVVSEHLNEIRKFDPAGNLIWKKEYQDFDIINISDGNSGNYSLIGFDHERFKYVSKAINAQGIVAGETILSLPIKYFDIIHQKGGFISAYDKSTGKLLFSTSADNVEKTVPHGIIVKDITTLENGNILVGGEFKGIVNVEGRFYNSNGYKNPVFLTYDKTGSLLSCRPVLVSRDETIKGIASKGNDEVAYHGRYREVVYHAPDPVDNIIDSCIFVNIIKLSEHCETPIPIVQMDSNSCTILIAPFTTGNQYTLQSKTEDTWTDVMDATTSSLSPPSNGMYRIKVSEAGCVPSVSDSISVQCLPVNISCDDHLLDLVYDSINHKFLYFLGESSSGIDSIIGNSIDIDILEGSIREMVKYEISYQWIKFVRFDVAGNTYLFGTNGLTKTFVIKITSTGVTTTYWYDNFIISTLAQDFTSSTFGIIGYDILSHKMTTMWITYFGQVMKKEILGDVVSGDGSGPAWQYHRDGVYSSWQVINNQNIIRWRYGLISHQATSLPGTLKIMNILRSSVTGWVVTATFTGTITIEGIPYTVGSSPNVIMIWYTDTGSIWRVKVIEHKKYTQISHIVTDGFGHFALLGIVKDSVFIPGNPGSYQEINCTYLEGFNVSSTIQLRPSPLVIGQKIKPEPDSDRQTINGNLKFYPNPFTKGITMDIIAEQSETVTLETYNNLGALMFSTKLDIQQGNNSRYIDAFEQVPLGVYTVIVKASEVEYISRVIRVE